MTVTRKSVLRSVRLDDDVWAAIKGMDKSLNQFFREMFELDGSVGIVKAVEGAGTLQHKGTKPWQGPLLRPGEKK